MRATSTRVQTGGRIVIPSAIRASAGPRDSDDAQVELADDDAIHLIPLERAISRVQELLAPYMAPHRSLADELIVESRTEAGRS